MQKEEGSVAANWLLVTMTKSSPAHILSFPITKQLLFSNNKLQGVDAIVDFYTSFLIVE